MTDSDGREPEGIAREVCLRLLSARPRTRAELETALAKREVAPDVARRVLDRFEELRWVDDAAYAGAWVQSRHAHRGLSRRALAQELRQRGVAAEQVEAAVDAVSDEDEEATAFRLARVRAAATTRLARDVRIRRLTGVLLRRGYSSSLTTRAVLAALDGPSALDDLRDEQGLTDDG